MLCVKDFSRCAAVAAVQDGEQLGCQYGGLHRSGTGTSTVHTRFGLLAQADVSE